VGRPNVGKSTLFNRIVGSRRAIVGDEPGITRDRLYGMRSGADAASASSTPAELSRKTRISFRRRFFVRLGLRSMKPAAIVMVVDGRAEVAGPDLELVRLLRKTGRPLFLAVNKADTEKQASILDEFHRLGIKQMFPVSAEHGRGIDDLLDAVFEIFTA